MTQKANFNRLTRVARAMRARDPEKPRLRMVFTCRKLNRAVVDGKTMTIAEYEASRDQNEPFIIWPNAGDY